MKKRPAKKPTPRDYAVAQNILRGDSPTKACINGGYSRTTARTRGAQICKSDRIQTALAQIGENLSNQKLGNIAKARLNEELIFPPKGARNARARIATIRTGLEIAGHLGGPSELHLHNHQTLPPVVQKMLMEKMAEIMGKQPPTIEAAQDVTPDVSHE